MEPFTTRDAAIDAKHPVSDLDFSADWMDRDPDALYGHLATKLEASLGQALPQMEIRYNVSLTARVKVLDQEQFEVPSVASVLKRVFVPAQTVVVEKKILKDVGGVLRPGTMTLVLGQPGSGKSALLKLLSGQFPRSRNVSMEGSISYNGVSQESLQARLPQFISYVEQRDKHYSTLTVKETLEFAHEFTGGELFRCRAALLTKGTSDENAAASAAVLDMQRGLPNHVAKSLGLSKSLDTVVGDELLRGLSGGERKRLTLGEMMFGMKDVAIMDEVSTGLDSATTFDIVTMQRSIARKMKKTVVMALLQPTPEVFSLFDDVILLNEGEVLYHGPPARVVEYFSSLGLDCPSSRDPADFLLDNGTEQQLEYEMTGMDVPRTAAELAARFRQSELYHSICESLSSPLSLELQNQVKDYMDNVPEFHLSAWVGTLILARRQTMLAWRNKSFMMARAAMIMLMGLLYGSAFRSFDPTDVLLVLAVIFNAAIVISLSQMPQVPIIIGEREVFYKQRAANFYRASSFVVASVIKQVPFAFLEAVGFVTIVYWICGFTPSVWSYLLFIAVMMLLCLVLGAWFFFVATISPDALVAAAFTSLSYVVLIIFTGFIILSGQISDYLVDVYWANPASWAIRAVAVDQYLSDAWNVCEYDGVNYCAQYGRSMGVYYLESFDILADKCWIGFGILYLVAALVVFMCLSSLALEYCRYEDSGHTASLNPSLSSSEMDKYDVYMLAQSPTHADKSSIVTIKPESAVVDVSSHPFAINPVTLAFQDLCYSVPSQINSKESIELLKGVSGFARPKTMTALMGSSGAGKTTLMDVIAGRKTGGTISGKIFLNGHEADELAIRRTTGYCEQMDVHSESTTFREAIMFSAFLRQDSKIPANHRFDTVDECLDMLDLRSIADKIVRGSSVEQLKRLSIAIELAAQPSLLFLDESTSGLDARAAKIVADSLRRVADTGRTVVCTIHQPSAEVFRVFDSLLLLKRGGKMVFFGEIGRDCTHLISYFASVPGTPPLRDDANPASWMLECIGAGVQANGKGSAELDFANHFAASPESARLLQELDMEGVTRPSMSLVKVSFAQKHAASSLVQCRFVVARFLKMYWRTPSFSLTCVALLIVQALLFGIILLGADFTTYQGVVSGMGMLYMVVVFDGFVTLNGVIPLASNERASYYRERSSETYRAVWYFVGSTAAEIPLTMVASLLFTAIFYPLVGFSGWDTASLFWLNLWLFGLQQAYVG